MDKLCFFLKKKCFVRSSKFVKFCKTFTLSIYQNEIWSDMSAYMTNISTPILVFSFILKTEN